MCVKQQLRHHTPDLNVSSGGGCKLHPVICVRNNATRKKLIRGKLATSNIGIMLCMLLPCRCETNLI